MGHILPLNHFNSYLAGLFAQGGRFAVAMVSRDVTIIHPQALSDRALPSLASLAPLLMCRHVLCLAGAAAKRNGSGSMLPSRCSARQGGSLGSLGLQSISPQRRCRDERYGSDIVMFEGGIGDGPFLADPRSIGSESETLLRPFFRCHPHQDAHSARPSSCPTLLETGNPSCPPFPGRLGSLLPAISLFCIPAARSVAAMGTSSSQVQKTLTFRFCEERHDSQKRKFATTNQAGIAEFRTVIIKKAHMNAPIKRPLT
jgi:hypothetical protein